MKCLPLVLLEPIALWWKAMEVQCVKGSTDVWPFVTLLARGKCLEKGEGSSPSKIRIVRVMSLLYTLYTSIRYEQTEEWRRQVMPESMKGARSGAHPHDVAWPLAVRIERAKAKGEQFAGCSLDRTKCFDR